MPSPPKAPPLRLPLTQNRSESTASSFEVVPGRAVNFAEVRPVAGEAEHGEDQSATAALHGPAAVPEGSVGGDLEVGQVQAPPGPEVALGLVEAVVGALHLDRQTRDADGHVGEGGGV